MPKPKVKEGIRKGFYLEQETIDEIKRCAGINEMSESGYLDFLITRERLFQNPMLQLKQIQFQKEELQTKLKELELKEKEAIESADKLHEWQKLKLMKKPEAIRIIQNKIFNRDFEGAEESSKIWSRMLGISAIELLTEAKANISRGI